MHQDASLGMVVHQGLVDGVPFLGGSTTFHRPIQAVWGEHSASYPAVLEDSSNSEKSERKVDRLISTTKVSAWTNPHLSVPNTFVARGKVRQRVYVYILFWTLKMI